jgi:ATP-dependent DNA helicase RecG
MNEAIDRLRKYIQLEFERDFDNKAVVGGMSRMLEPWTEQARQSGLEDDVIEVVSARLRDYARLSPNSRREALQGLWDRLRTDLGDLEPLTPADGTEGKGKAQESASGTGTGSQTPPEAETLADDDSAEKGEEKLGGAEPATAHAEAPAALDAPLTTISGIGPKSSKTLGKLELETLGDLLWHFPRRYDDYSQLKTINRIWYGEEVTIIANVDEIEVRPVRGGKMKLTEAVVSDGTGSLRVTWFNQPWIARSLKPGQAVVLSSKVDQYLGRLVLSNPEWEPLEREQLHTNRIVPVYPLTAGVTAKWMRKVLHSVVRRLAPRIPDPIPEVIQRSVSLVPLAEALEQVHFPDSWEQLRRAQHRLAFDEMFLLQLGVLRQKAEWEHERTDPLRIEDAWLEKYLSSLPFQLTGAQEAALQDIRSDLASERPMNRLLEGDVGSGKTVLAAAAIGIATANGSQSALMAPTSILAEQHFLTLRDLLPGAAGVDSNRIRLLMGSTPDAEKEGIRSGLANGKIDLVIGTHALLEEPVSFKRLGLAIIDEQHRFGVEQRASLRSKGITPNLMVMTATPIPRSLALTIYGDLDLSIIDINRSRAYNFILGQLQESRQAFIIYPLVEGSEKVQAKAAVDEHKILQDEVFFEYQVGLLHGRMRPEEKETVMASFRAGDLDVLVSTSVVEVGVDITNATVVLIEGANRFGLSQLHQFRGRVGRGTHASYCLLIPDRDEEMDNERLMAMESTNDGFVLAEKDLEQRGPGDFFGTRQAGFAEIQMARLTDVKLIELARREAKSLFERDPNLEEDQHQTLAEALGRAWADGKGEIS